MRFSDAKILPTPPYTPPGSIGIREGFGPLELFQGFSTVWRPEGIAFRAHFFAQFLIGLWAGFSKKNARTQIFVSVSLPIDTNGRVYAHLRHRFRKQLIMIPLNKNANFMTIMDSFFLLWYNLAWE